MKIRARRSSSCFLPLEARGVDDFPVAIATTYVNPADFRADGGTRRISFPAARMPAASRLPARPPSWWFRCLERHALRRTYVQTLLRAMVTLQNDHLLPQSYYR